MSRVKTSEGVGHITGSERSCQSAKGWHQALRRVFNNWKVNNERAVNKQLWFSKLFILTILPVRAQRREKVCVFSSSPLWTCADAELFTRWTAEGARVTSKKGGCRSLRCPRLGEGKIYEIRELKRGGKEDREWVDRHGNAKTCFSQGAQI